MVTYSRHHLRSNGTGRDKKMLRKPKTEPIPCVKNFRLSEFEATLTGSSASGSVCLLFILGFPVPGPGEVVMGVRP